MSIKPIQKKLSQRTQALLSHPQGMGNYFTFKSAIDILGLDWNDVAPFQFLVSRSWIATPGTPER